MVLINSSVACSYHLHVRIRVFMLLRIILFILRERF